MKLSSDLLSRLSKSLPQSELDPAEGVLEIPSLFLPTLTIPGPQSRTAGFSTTAIQRESFRVAQIRSHPASTIEDLRVTCTFGRGLWLVDIGYKFVASYTALFDGSVSLANSIELLDPGAATIEVFHADAVLNVPQIFQSKFLYHFFEDSWQLQMRTGATGVAQTHTGFATVLANRLL